VLGVWGRRRNAGGQRTEREAALVP
jgi:hypothetical protein